MPTQPKEPYEGREQPGRPTYDDYDSLWVRDEGYGAPAFGQATVGIFQILLGIVQWISELGTGNKRAK